MTAPLPPGLPARRVALRLIDAVLRQGLPLDSVMARTTARLERADDRGLAYAIASATLRRLPDLDTLIDTATAKPLPPDAKARNVLRIALAQALILNTPPHAAIATTLPLVDGGPRRLVHGVFGTLTRRGAALPALATLPATVEKRWLGSWGAEVIEAARALITDPPPIDLTIADEDATETWARRLAGTSLTRGHVRLPRGTDVRDLPGYAAGAWWVQDMAAAIPARLLGHGPGRALDLCAAPGGKTMQLAVAGWDVTALDISEARLGRLRDNLSRTGLTADVVTGDALRYDSGSPFDAVLLDAPCSATGIFRRHPEVLHRVGQRAIDELAGVQMAMLAHAASLVAPGGRLVYAVCSLEQREGEDIVTQFRDDRFIPEPIRADEVPSGMTPDDNGNMRVLPGMMLAAGGADGFFVARFRRKGPTG